MKKRLRRFKWVFIIFGLFATCLLCTWLFLPTVIIDYVEENDSEWINREITIENLKINPFNLSLTLLGTKISEAASDSTFASFDKLYVNLAFWPLLQSHLKVEAITLQNLHGNIIQNGDRFNFSDLLSTGDGQGTTTTTDDEAGLEFSLQDITVTGSSIRYMDKVIGSSLMLDSITIRDETFTSQDTFFDASLKMHQAEGGWLLGKLYFDFNSGNYHLETDFDAWELSPLKPYVTSTLQLSQFGGQLSSHLKVDGNTKLTDYFQSSGQVSLSKLKMLDPEKDTLVVMGALLLEIDSLNTKSNLYDFNKIFFDRLYVKFDYLPNGDNFSKWLVTNDTSHVNPVDSLAINTSGYYASPFELLSLYIYDMTKDYIFKSYSADSVIIRDFNLDFHDYTLEDPFYLDLSQVNVMSHDIKPENQEARFDIRGKVNSTGTLGGNIRVSRDGVENMAIQLGIEGLFLNRFSPYCRHYTGHNFKEGIASFKNESTIEEFYLKSNNQIFVEKIEVGKKNKVKSGYSLPMKLAVALMRDIEGNINLEIPIEGPLNDPKYKFGKVIWQIVKNVFTKAATAPIKAISNSLSLNEDDLENVYFNNGQIGLDVMQVKSLNSIAKVLLGKPEMVIHFDHLYNKNYEMDALAVHRAKLSYLTASDLPKNDKEPLGKQAARIPTTDGSFLKYLANNTPNYDSTISIPENARRFYGPQALEVELKRVITKQQTLVKEFLTNEKGIPETRFDIKDLSNDQISINQTKPKFKVNFSIKEDDGG